MLGRNPHHHRLGMAGTANVQRSICLRTRSPPARDCQELVTERNYINRQANLRSSIAWEIVVPQGFMRSHDRFLVSMSVVGSSERCKTDDKGRSQHFSFLREVKMKSRSRILLHAKLTNKKGRRRKPLVNWP